MNIHDANQSSCRVLSKHSSDSCKNRTLVEVLLDSDSEDEAEHQQISSEISLISPAVKRSSRRQVIQNNESATVPTKMLIDNVLLLCCHDCSCCKKIGNYLKLMPTNKLLLHSASGSSSGSGLSSSHNGTKQIDIVNEKDRMPKKINIISCQTMPPSKSSRKAVNLDKYRSFGTPDVTNMVSAKTLNNSTVVDLSLGPRNGKDTDLENERSQPEINNLSWDFNEKSLRNRNVLLVESKKRAIPKRSKLNVIVANPVKDDISNECNHTAGPRNGKDTDSEKEKIQAEISNLSCGLNTDFKKGSKKRSRKRRILLVERKKRAIPRKSKLNVPIVNSVKDDLNNEYYHSAGPRNEKDTALENERSQPEINNLSCDFNEKSLRTRNVLLVESKKRAIPKRSKLNVIVANPVKDDISNECNRATGPRNEKDTDSEKGRIQAEISNLSCGLNTDFKKGSKKRSRKRRILLGERRKRAIPRKPKLNGPIVNSVKDDLNNEYYHSAVLEKSPYISKHKRRARQMLTPTETSFDQSLKKRLFNLSLDPVPERAIARKLGRTGGMSLIIDSLNCTVGDFRPSSARKSRNLYSSDGWLNSEEFLKLSGDE